MSDIHLPRRNMRLVCPTCGLERHVPDDWREVVGVTVMFCAADGTAMEEHHVIPPPLTRLQALIPPATPIEVAHDGHMWRVCLGPNASLLVSNIAQALSVWAKTARLPLVSPMLLDRAVDEGDHE